MASHDASASMLGYLYQVKWALTELIRGSRDRPDLALTLEQFDDVAWDKSGSPVELLQTKHHKPSAGSLTDKSADLWKSLKVWMDDPRLSDAEGPVLTLVTTGVAPAGSAAELLRPDSYRDDARAVELLDAAAVESTEKAKTAAARSAWIALDPATRLGIAMRMRVLDGALPIEDLDSELEGLVWPAPPSNHEADFLAELWGWWTSVAIDMLRGARRAVTGGELKAKLDDIRDKFLPDNLPTVAAAIKRAEAMTVHGDKVFVHQLRWVEVSPVLLEKAVVDYHRAVSQTTEWLDRNLLEMTEFDRFKEALIDEWETAYEDMISLLPAAATHDDKVAAGRELYRALRDSIAVRVRERYTDAFYSRGTRYEIADSGAYGWHPDFLDLVNKLTVGRTVA
jgi:hypothetical protein